MQSTRRASSRATVRHAFAQFMSANEAVQERPQRKALSIKEQGSESSAGLRMVPFDDSA
jgi:hypothetical protein